MKNPSRYEILSPYLSQVGGHGIYSHYCPGCKDWHVFHVSRKNHCGAQWSFNGDVNKPTFHPSMNMPGICHYWLRDGKIQFLDDSSHHLKGKTVDLPPLPQCNEEFNEWIDLQLMLDPNFTP